MRLFISWLLWLKSLASGLDLVGNYKFWQSISDTMIYDYSGNSLHASLKQFATNAAYYTDRGLYIQNKCLVNLPSNHYNLFPVYPDVLLNYWYYPLSFRDHRVAQISYSNQKRKVSFIKSSSNSYNIRLQSQSENNIFQGTQVTVGNA
jgi:hypothetical protein